jgi:hypothetical protein
MKTTVEISDSLMRDVRKLAAREGVTFRALLERGLRRVLSEQKPTASFKLKKASFKGHGLQPEFQDAPWSNIRDASYGEGGA